MYKELKNTVERAWDDRSLLSSDEVRAALRAVVDEVDKGRLRTARPVDAEQSLWQVNE